MTTMNLIPGNSSITQNNILPKIINLKQETRIKSIGNYLNVAEHCLSNKQIE